MISGWMACFFFSSNKTFWSTVNATMLAWLSTCLLLDLAITLQRVNLRVPWHMCCTTLGIVGLLSIPTFVVFTFESIPSIDLLCLSHVLVKKKKLWHIWHICNASIDCFMLFHVVSTYLHWFHRCSAAAVSWTFSRFHRVQCSNSVLPCFFLVYIISGDTSILKFVS